MILKKLLIAWVILFSKIALATNVTLIIPDKEGPAFWNLVEQSTVSAAKSLGVELEVIYGAENRFITLEIINAIVRRPIKPDYLIFRPYHGNSAAVFAQIEASGISFVTLEQAFLGSEALELQKPKQKFQYWLGEVAYDNVKGGEMLIDTLMAEHSHRHPLLKPSVIGIGGNFDNLSISRQQALNNLKRDRSVQINQIFPTYWDPKNIATNFAKMVERYPNTNIFWCAGDQLALETFKQYQLRFKDPIVIGGFDWLPDVLVQIQKGGMTASVGGHFLMGTIALTKIFDYENGIDRFTEETNSYDFELITKDNVDRYIDFMQNQQWRHANFNQFSAFKMGKEPEPLTVKNIIKQLHH